VSLLGLALGAALAPVLVDLLGARFAFVPLGILGAALVASVLGMLRKLDGRAVLRSREIDLLGRIPFLAPLPPYEMERLARDAGWLDVGARTDIVRQGESGNQFYVIEAGEFEVVVDGVARRNLLGPGQGFGELALLLRSAPRSATVSSVTGGRLLVVGGPDFLAVVTGTMDGQALAEEMTQAYRRAEGQRGG
jgi:CRP-like cAMP-binding protein